MHQNFVGIDGSKSPFVLSVCLTDSDNYGVPQYRAILWRKTVSMKGSLDLYIMICIKWGPEFLPSKPLLYVNISPTKSWQKKG